MPTRYESRVLMYVQVAVLILGAVNAWWTARVDTAVAQMEVRMERRITDLAMGMRPTVTAQGRETR